MKFLTDAVERSLYKTSPLAWAVYLVMKHGSHDKKLTEGMRACVPEEIQTIVREAYKQ